MSETPANLKEVKNIRMSVLIRILRPYIDLEPVLKGEVRQAEAALGEAWNEEELEAFSKELG